jgi:hypothetical protein
MATKNKPADGLGRRLLAREIGTAISRAAWKSPSEGPPLVSRDTGPRDAHPYHVGALSAPWSVSRETVPLVSESWAQDSELDEVGGPLVGADVEVDGGRTDVGVPEGVLESVDGAPVV